MSTKRPLEQDVPAAGEESAKKLKGVVYGVAALLPPEIPIAFAPSPATPDQVLEPSSLTTPQAQPSDDPVSPAADDEEKEKDENENENENDGSEESVVEKVQLLLMDAVEELSVVSRTLERWTVFAPSVGVSEEQRNTEQKRYDEAVKKGKQRIVEHL
eukprot:Gregarina_sp_Poly_1__6587@NODE_3534_length_1027_cov_83_684375_g51_i2_p2_GENE_NODE_3534_length_1027_cov_83_684375_g51_i2NODE_3534_length_1027_cov_83_684375_g51_i2_p2_ORF_typecomplete_len158_score41_10Sigma70_ner/PF04546_13/0_0048ORC_WH_C/PF18137_1/0_17ORC_WH_C/PF18137_1/2_6e03_NODE_3534_length_1027_cov_83_684375_g51_i2109582